MRRGAVVGSRVVALAGALALAACATASSPPMTAFDAPIAVAAGGDSFFLCTRDHVELRSETASEETLNVPPDAGDPAAMALDVVSGWAGVAYHSRLAIFQLADRRVIWSKDPLPEPPLAMAVAADRIATVSNSTLTLFRLPDGALESRRDLLAWRKQFGFDQIRFVLPRADQQLLLVGFRNMSLTGPSRIVFQRIDAARGDWAPVQTSSDEGITFIHACASDGRWLYVAGTQEYCRGPPSGSVAAAAPGLGGAPRGGPGRGDLLLTLVVKRVDPETLRSEEIVWDEQHSRSVNVRQLVAGGDLMAVVLDDGELRVYRLHAQGGTGAPIFRGRFGPGITAAWLSPSDLLVTDRDGASKVVAVGK